MADATLVSEEEYLRTLYRPDVDFVDGMLVERNVGELDHSMLQGEIALYVRNHLRSAGFDAFISLRTRIRPGRYRVLDVAILHGRRPRTKNLEQAPFAAVEVLSPEDTFTHVQQRIDDYLAMGTPYVWVIDPETRRAWVYREGSIEESKDGNLKAGPPDFVLPLKEIFAGIDAMRE